MKPKRPRCGKQRKGEIQEKVGSLQIGRVPEKLLREAGIDTFRKKIHDSHWRFQCNQKIKLSINEFGRNCSARPQQTGEGVSMNFFSVLCNVISFVVTLSFREARAILVLVQTLL